MFRLFPSSPHGFILFLVINIVPAVLFIPNDVFIVNFNILIMLLGHFTKEQYL